MMNDKTCIHDLEQIKDSFISGTDGAYPECLEYAINRLKALTEFEHNLSRDKAVKELEFLMEGYRQLLDCKEPNPRYEDIYDACRMGRDAIKVVIK